MRRFSTAECNALFAAILVNDVVDEVVELPDAIRIDYPAGHLEDGFAISAQLWREGFDRAALLAFVARVARGTAIDADEQLWFKHVRAKFKHLRFAFVLYGADHTCPRLFKSLTTSMGLLQDAYRNGRRQAIRRQALLIRLMLGRPLLALLHREVDSHRMCDPASFRAFTSRQITDLRATLARPEINAHQFHAARKVVSRQVSFHDDMRTIHPMPEHMVLSRYLSAINGLMGAHHDVLVEQGGRGELDYARAPIAMPAEIRERLDALVSRYPGDLTT